MTASDDTLRVFIENEAGSSTKNTFNEKTLQFLGRQGVSCPYPYPYGFALDTRGGDGDCVDCFVVTEKMLKSGDVVECVPLHLLEQYEDGDVDHKILGVLAGSPEVVEESAVEAIRTFATGVFSHVPGKTMRLGDLLGKSNAEEFVRRCRV